MKMTFRKYSSYLYMALVFTIIFLLMGYALFKVEGGLNPRCRTYFDALWLSIVFFLNGFEDFGPVTNQGKLISLLMFLWGTGFMIVLTGLIASIFVQLKMKEKKMPRNLKDHIVLCNWEFGGGDRIVQELHSPLAEPETPLVIVTQKPFDERALKMNDWYKKVHFISGDPTCHHVLQRARINYAKSAIVLADRESKDPDTASVLTLLAIRGVCSERFPYTVVENVDPERSRHLQEAGAAELVCSENYGLGILAQCALHQKISEVYHHMLTYSDDTNEMYIVESERYPSKLFAGKTFIEAANFFNEHRDPENPAILIGLRRNKDDQIILNPRHNEEGFTTFEEGDDLIFIAYNTPDLTRLKA